jgi:4-aminobutyrate aminotransferase-like enzyme
VGAPATKQNIIRLLPPFVVTAAEIDTALNILDRAIFNVTKNTEQKPRVAAAR